MAAIVRRTGPIQRAREGCRNRLSMDRPRVDRSISPQRTELLCIDFKKKYFFGQVINVKISVQAHNLFSHFRISTVCTGADLDPCRGIEH